MLDPCTDRAGGDVVGELGELVEAVGEPGQPRGGGALFDEALGGDAGASIATSAEQGGDSADESVVSINNVSGPDDATVEVSA